MNARTLSLFATLALGASCASQAQWSTDDALTAERVEVEVDEAGAAREIEYHVEPDQVPAAVHTAMNERHPGGLVIGGEKEVRKGATYWELSKSISGRSVEAMFTEDGEFVGAEVEVAAGDVPERVHGAVRARMDGNPTKWETVHDGDDELVEYHVKVASGGKQYKLVVSPEGEVTAVVRELRAEIEVPVR